MSPACGPNVSTQPKMTSSTASGSAAGLRSKRAVITCAPRSAGCTCERPPFLRPTGVRTASTRKASRMSGSVRVSSDPVEDDREVLAGDVGDAELAAGAVPADADPDGVTQEPVGEFDVEVPAETAVGDTRL